MNEEIWVYGYLIIIAALLILVGVLLLFVLIRLITIITKLNSINKRLNNEPAMKLLEGGKIHMERVIKEAKIHPGDLKK